MSDCEAHPVAVMEALCVARPVVGYDIAGIGELVAEGWVRGVPCAAPAATVARELVKAMSSPSQVDHVQLADWDSCAAQLAHVYLSSLGVSPRAGSCERETPPARQIAIAWGMEATMAEARKGGARSDRSLKLYRRNNTQFHYPDHYPGGLLKAVRNLAVTFQRSMRLLPWLHYSH